MSLLKKTVPTKIVFGFGKLSGILKNGPQDPVGSKSAYFITAIKTPVQRAIKLLKQKMKVILTS